MEKLKYKYLEDDQAQQAGTNQRGNKGCIAKSATKVKRDIMKNINRKAAKTHGTSAPVILGEYESRKTKYKREMTMQDLTSMKICILRFVVKLSTFAEKHINYHG